MELVLLRHFKTPGNLRRCYIGATDESLFQGPDFAQYVEQKRKDLPESEIIVASPMKRCKETANYLYPGKDVILEDSFRECNFGFFEGKNYEELKENPMYQKWLDSGGTIPFPGGEAHEVFQARCVDGFERMTNQFIESGVQRVAYVVHGGTIMAILQELDEEDRGFYHWQIGNGEGYTLQIDEAEWRLGIRRFKEIRKL
ncbi:MAG: histidine phosphatase family protein [Hespellia sp.]|nr:histidine phosphatase family protein [Hespellia sp.]